MAKPTIKSLSERLDTASRCMSAQMKRIEQLEAQADKTRKQLWYLQKIAKGEFKPQAAKPNGKAQPQAQAQPEDQPF